MAENEGFQVSGQANNAPDGVTCRVEFRDPNNQDSAGADVLLLTVPVSVSGQRYALDVPQATTALLPDEIYADLIVIDTAGNSKTRRLQDNGRSILVRTSSLVDAVTSDLTLALSGLRVTATIQLSANDSCQVFWRVQGEAEWIPREPSETSSNYGFETPHQQSFDIPSDSTVEVYAQGENYETDIVTIVHTSTASTSWVAILPSQFQTNGTSDNASYSDDWSDEDTFVPNGGATDAWKIVVPQGEHYGANRIFEGFPERVQEIEVIAEIMIQEGHSLVWNDADQGLKSLGMCGKVGPEYGGYGGSSLTYLPQGNRAPSARGLIQPLSSTYSPDANQREKGMEVYSAESTNGPNGNNIRGLPKYNGKATWLAPNSSVSSAQHLVGGVWGEYYQRLKMNTPGLADGELHAHLNGDADSGFSNTGIEWIEPLADWQDYVDDGRLPSEWDGPNYLLDQGWYRFWLDFYHGGNSTKNTAGDLVLYVRNIRYRVISQL